MVSTTTLSPAPLDATVKLASTARLQHFFAPRSIAIVGASENAYWGRNALSNFPVIGFDGQVVPVNPKRKMVFGRDCIASLRDLDSPVDLVYVAAPTAAVPSVLADAAHADIRNAVVISAGFAESGQDGAHLQSSLIQQAHESNITILGPNCPGFINFTNHVSAYGQEIPGDIPTGSVSIILQSGALTTVFLKFARAHGVGLSKVVCMGNEAVISAVDVLEYLIDDDATKVVAMFLEQITDGGRFFNVARRALAAGKAIIVLKVGRTPEGQKAALAHTGAVAGDDAVVDAAFRQSGVVRAHSLEELLITAGLLSRIAPLNGTRMAVISGSGGACDIIADRASDEGLQMPPFSPSIHAELKEYLPHFATVQNPLDTAAVDTLRETGSAAVAMDVVAEIVSRDPAFDFILYNGFNVVPQTAVNSIEADKNIARIAHVGELLQNSERPIVPLSLSCLEVGPFARSLYDANNIFMLGGIEFGLTAIGHAVRWNNARMKLRPTTTHSPRTASLAYLDRKRTWSEFEGRELLQTNGVPLVPARLVQSADDAVNASGSFGYPVVLKVCSPIIAHKSDIGGVALNLHGADDVRTAFTKIVAAGRLAANGEIDGVLVSPMRPRGIELFAGVTVDPSFGPTLAVGLGGIWIEILQDVSLRLLPVTEQDVTEMLCSLRSKSLLDGARGGPRVNIQTLAQAICKIANAALSIGPHLEAFEVNPIWALDDQVEALDVLVVTH